MTPEMPRTAGASTATLALTINLAALGFLGVDELETERLDPTSLFNVTAVVGALQTLAAMLFVGVGDSPSSAASLASGAAAALRSGDARLDGRLLTGDGRHG